jgi:hypothetical protein
MSKAACTISSRFSLSKCEYIPQTPQKVKTISWKQGVYGIRRGMSNGELENLWVSEKHDTATGKTHASVVSS